MEMARRTVVKGAAWSATGVAATAVAGGALATSAQASPASWAAAHPRCIDFCTYARYEYGARPRPQTYDAYRGGIMNIQARLGLRRDGSYGTITRASVISFQRRNGLAADGVVGTRTAARLGLRDISPCE